MRDDDLGKILRTGSRSVAEATRPRSAQRVRARGDQRRRRKAIGSALAVIALLAGAGAGYAGVRLSAPAPVSHGGTPAPVATKTPPAHPRPGTSTSTARLLPAGQTGQRGAVPWSLVGAGWSLAESAAGPADSSGQWPGGGAMTLSLVDPAGGRYVIYRQASSRPPWTLLAWSGSGARALFGVSTAAEPPYREYREITLATGAVSSFAVPAGVTPVGFTRPDGTNILAVRRHDGRIALQRYSLTGTLQATLASHVVSAARPGLANCGTTCGAYSSPDGTSVIWADGDNLQLVGNAGGVLRDLPVTSGGQRQACEPLRWWDGQTVLAECSGTTGLRLWLVPAGGAAPTPLADAVGAGSDYGIPTGAWSLSGAVYLNRTTGSGCPQAPTGPDGSGIFRAAASGPPSPVSVPGSDGGDSRVLGTSGDRLLVLARTSCPGSAALLWFSPAAGTAQPLLTASAGAAGVVAALPFDAG